MRNVATPLIKFLGPGQTSLPSGLMALLVAGPVSASILFLENIILMIYLSDGVDRFPSLEQLLGLIFVMLLTYVAMLWVAVPMLAAGIIGVIFPLWFLTWALRREYGILYIVVPALSAPWVARYFRPQDGEISYNQIFDVLSIGIAAGTGLVFWYIASSASFQRGVRSDLI